MRAEDRIRLLHMVEASQAAMRFVAGRQRADLQTDQMLLFAVIRALEVVGEAANKVSEEVRAENPNIPWKAIVGMRNRLIHAYFDVDTHGVGDAAVGDSRCTYRSRDTVKPILACYTTHIRHLPFAAHAHPYRRPHRPRNPRPA